jgi:uncharacterized membrane protein
MSDPNMPPTPGEDPTGGSVPPPPPPPSGMPPPPPPPPGGMPPPPPAPGIPPSGAGYTAYAPGGIAAPQIDVGDSVNWSIKKFQQYIGQFLTLSAVIVAVQVIGGIVVYELARNSGTLTINQQTGALETSSTFWGGIIGALVIGMLVTIAVWLLRIGLLRAALRTSSGEVPSMADLTTGHNTGAYILTAIVVGVLVAVGTLLCILPGLAAAFFLIFAATHSLDKGAGVGDSLRWSFEAVKTNVVPVIILVLLTFVVGIVASLFRHSIAGIVIVGVLTLFIEPIFALLNANIYRKLGQEPIAPVEA